MKVLKTGRQFLIFLLILSLAGCASHSLSAQQLSLTPSLKANQPLEKQKGTSNFPIQNFAINAKYKF